MAVIAFDAKEFVRTKRVSLESPSSTDLTGRKELAFFTPLGAGVSFVNEQGFINEYLQTVRKLAIDFGVPSRRVIYCSYTLKNEIGLKDAIPFCDNLVQSLRKYIKSIFISYVILPPKKIPYVEVGGYKCPKEQVPTVKFLRNLCPIFSYITAWSFFGRPRSEKYTVLIDGFTSRHTQAWHDLIGSVEPKVYPKGDECNPYISFADMIAFLTDAKLYTKKLKLEPSNIEQIWKPYGFDVEARFLDKKLLSKYKWYSRDPIDLNAYLARPMTFMLVDEIEKLGMGAPRILEEPRISEKPRKFHKVLQRTDPFFAAIAHAFHRGGGVQLFDPNTDAEKIRDGDTLVYIGAASKRMAETFGDMYEVDVLSAKELRKKNL